MYVRNYGVSSRATSRGDTAYLKTAPTGTEAGGGSVEGCALSFGEHGSVEPEACRAERDSEEQEICDEAGDESTIVEPSCDGQPIDNARDEGTVAEDERGKAVFGANGIPPQPLRRRSMPKRRKKGADDEAVVPDIPDATELSETCRCCTEEVSGELCRGEGNRRPELAPAERGVREKYRGRSARERLLSEEDILLGGLLLMLINDHANDDIILILAFLFISGLGGDRSVTRECVI